MHGLAAYRDAWMLADLIISIVDVIIVVVVRITVMAMQTTYIKIDQKQTSCTTLPIVPTVQCCNTIQ